MKVAVVHYHLRRGGVTRVIENAAAALAQNGCDVELAVLSGESPPESAPFPLPVEVVPGLGYCEKGDAAGAGELAAALENAARAAFHGELPDLWHVHNHGLGKNVTLPAALRRLAEQGARFLLQIHDFAEDGRPKNYRLQRAFYKGADESFAADLYPDAPQIHYAALNRRDARFLEAAGVKPGRLHLLANAVAAPPGERPDPKARPFARDKVFFLYPTRGIRRKNLGELTLLASLHGERAHFATALTPDNPEWLPAHHHWAGVIRRHALPVDLGIGEAHSYADLLGWSDALITTSVAEGFGLAFLEPWLVDRAVAGRNLPEITGDFAAAGIDLSSLYDTLPFPAHWIDRDRLCRKIDDALDVFATAYGRDFPPDAVEQALAAFEVSPGQIDFGRLDEELQTAVIEHVAEGASGIELSEYLDVPGAAEMARNRAAVEARYDLGLYGLRLERIYRDILAAELEPGGQLDPGALLDCFLDPARLNLLRAANMPA